MKYHPHVLGGGLGWAAEGPLGVVWMQPWSRGRRAVAMGLGKTEAKGT